MTDRHDALIPVATLQAANAAFAATEAGLRAALQERRDEAARLAAELDRTKAELKTQQTAAAVADAAAQGRVRDLEQRIDALTERLSHSTAALEEAGRQQDEQRTALVATASESERLREELAALQARLLEGTRAHGALTEELDHLRAESRQRQEAMTDAAEAEREKQAQQVSRLAAEVSALREEAGRQAAAHRYEIEQLRVRLGAAAAQIDDLRTDNNDLREAHAAELQAERARAAHVAAEAARLGEARRSELTQLRGSWERAVSEREARLRTTLAQLRGVEEHARWLGWTTERLQARIEEGQARERRLLQQWQQLRAEAQTLRAQLRAFTGQRVRALEQAPTPAAASATAPTDAPEEAPPMNDTLPDIQHVNQLLALRDARFVRAAYLSLLGREPDAEGLAQHLARVRTDHDKVAVVTHLVTSAEGEARPHRLAGLQELLAEQRPRESRGARWLQRVAMGFSGVRRVEAALDATAEELSVRLDAVERRLEQLAQTAAAVRQDTAQLHGLLERQTAGLSTALAGCQASVEACEQQLAALPAFIDGRLETLMQVQRQSLREALDEMRHKAGEPAPDSPPGPSAKELQLDAAQGATALLGELAGALASTQEAALLASRARP